MTDPTCGPPRATAALARFPERWAFASRFVRETLRYGYVPPFTRSPPSFSLRNPPREPAVQTFMYSEIQRMLDMGVVTEVSSDELVCVNPTFAVPKKNGKHRFILNTKLLNSFVDPPKFKYQTLSTVAERVQPGDRLISCDLSDGYWQVPLHPSVRKYFGFSETWPDGVTRFYIYNTLSFGLNSACHCFQKISAAAAAHISELLDISVNVFLDDYCASFNAARTDVAPKFFAALEHLGFVINYAKSVVEPTESLEYLGFVIDVSGPEPMFRAPSARIRDVRSDIRRVLRASTVPPRQLARLLGKLVSLTRAILPARTMLRTSYDMLPPSRKWASVELTLSKACRADLEEWLEMLEAWNGRVAALRPHQHLLQTDASKSGGGATLDGDQPVAFPFAPEWRNRSSNARELVTVLRSLEAYGEQLYGKRVRVLTDNTATVSYINHIFTGKSPGLYAIARRMFRYCHAHSITLQAAHVPGIDNVTPDWLSRLRFHDWSVRQSVFDFLHSMWPCTVDRFASSLTNKLPRFNARFLDVGCEAGDAMSQQWASDPGASYLCPPFPLLHQVVTKVKEEGVLATIIVPVWHSAPFFRLLGPMIVDTPYELSPACFVPAHNGRCPPRRWRMLAVRVCGSVSDSRSWPHWLSLAKHVDLSALIPELAAYRAALRAEREEAIADFFPLPFS